MTTATRQRTEPVTERTRRTYDRVARWYDLQEWLPERLAFRKWRSELWSLVPDGRVLEVGVGTGRNLRYYSEGMAVTAIDLSPKMLARATALARKEGVAVDLEVMDAQALEFQDSSFDSAVSTFVFCSVPDPILGLSEVRRVLRPGGRVHLLEHVLSSRQPARWLMQRLNGIMRTFDGANLNRDTVANVELAGFDLVDIRDLWGDIVKLIVAERAV